MEIEVPKETSVRVKEVSRLLGIKKQELVDRAILVYLDSISRHLDLRKEMKAWDQLSDEALLNFEKSL
ncbi:MAG TPA: hypothetical protein VJB08_06420 [Candidatus Nanoarchaeia archaeon]|nr:hypothetical protein [Candidatus Nanoarchaeia archaeon]